MAGVGRLPGPNSRSRTRGQQPVRLAADAKVKAPRLDPSIDWDPRSRAVFKNWYRSEMSPLWNDVDRDGLAQLILLVDSFFKAEDGRARAQIATEMRLQSARFGLDPASRSRLRWQKEAPKRSVGRARAAREASDEDPRDLLGKGGAVAPLDEFNDPATYESDEWLAMIAGDGAEVEYAAEGEDGVSRMRTGASLARALIGGDLAPDERLAVRRQLAASPYASSGSPRHPIVRHLGIADRRRIADSLAAGGESGDDLSELRTAQGALWDPREALAALHAPQPIVTPESVAQRRAQEPAEDLAEPGEEAIAEPEQPAEPVKAAPPVAKKPEAAPAPKPKRSGGLRLETGRELANLDRPKGQGTEVSFGDGGGR